MIEYKRMAKPFAYICSDRGKVMADMRILLAKAAEIINSRIAIITENETTVYPESTAIGISFEEACKKAGRSYKGWNIYIPDPSGARFFLCVGSDKYYESETTALIMLLIKSALEEEDPASKYLERLVEGKYDQAELANLEEYLRSCLPGHMLLIDNFGNSRDEVFDILVNSINIKTSMIYDNRIIALADEENIGEACSSFIKNVLSELFIECNAVIGGRAEKASQLHSLYKNCLEALSLRHIYGLSDSVTDYDGMYGYRVAYNLDPKLKKSIMDMVFTKEFEEIAEGELEKTIEEFFKNNLNITDTAAKLYVHRNTLLYRLEKIQKCTGFDIRRFEGSWLFKLAWIIHKEK